MAAIDFSISWKLGEKNVEILLLELLHGTIIW